MQNLLDNIVKPLSRRMGTYLGTMVVTYGATQETGQMVELAITAAVLVGGDLLASYWERKQARG